MFDPHGPDRSHPPSVAAEHDPVGARQRKPARLVRAVGPERHVELEWNDAGLWRQRGEADERARVGERLREIRNGGRPGLRHSQRRVRNAVGEHKGRWRMPGSRLGWEKTTGDGKLEHSHYRNQTAYG